MIGTSKSHIWRIENGNVGIGLDRLISLAEALEVKVRDLVTF